MKTSTIGLIQIYILIISGGIFTIIGAYYNSAYGYVVGIILTLMGFSLKFIHKEHYSKEPKSEVEE